MAVSYIKPLFSLVIVNEIAWKPVKGSIPFSKLYLKVPHLESENKKITKPNGLIYDQWDTKKNFLTNNITIVKDKIAFGFICLFENQQYYFW